MVPTHNSELAAAVALYMLFADGEASPEVYGAAADRQQASIVFDVANQMVKMTPALAKRAKILTANKRISVVVKIVVTKNILKLIVPSEPLTAISTMLRNTLSVDAALLPLTEYPTA